MNDRRNPPELERLQELLDRHGADAARFPDAERQAALDLLARDARAQRMLQDAAALERALGSLPQVEPSAALRRAVAEIPLRHPRPAAEVAFGFLPVRSLWALLSCGALILALGAASGALVADGALAPAEDTASLRPEDEALAELAELAFAADLEQELAP